MRYISTRGGGGRLTFEEAVLAGWAPDGGMLLPEHIPRLSAVEMQQWRCVVGEEPRRRMERSAKEEVR